MVVSIPFSPLDFPSQLLGLSPIWDFVYAAITPPRFQDHRELAGLVVGNNLVLLAAEDRRSLVACGCFDSLLMLPVPRCALGHSFLIGRLLACLLAYPPPVARTASLHDSSAMHSYASMNRLACCPPVLGLPVHISV